MNAFMYLHLCTFSPLKIFNTAYYWCIYCSIDNTPLRSILNLSPVPYHFIPLLPHCHLCPRRPLLRATCWLSAPAQVAVAAPCGLTFPSCIPRFWFFTCVFLQSCYPSFSWMVSGLPFASYKAHHGGSLPALMVLMPHWVLLCVLGMGGGGRFPTASAFPTPGSHPTPWGASSSPSCEGLCSLRGWITGFLRLLQVKPSENTSHS